MFEKVFDGRSAYDYALSWASSRSGHNNRGIFVFSAPSNSVLCRNEARNTGVSVVVKEQNLWTLTSLLDGITAVTVETGADSVVYAFADCPFLNGTLTEELMSTHEKYAAEYTFADGYPYGFAPEVLDKGTAVILAELSRTTQQKLGEAAVERNSISTLLKTDINSFEIETVLAPKDWRLYRFEFECGTKAGFTACRALYAAGNSGNMDVEKLSETAAGLETILKTVPGFYNVQIESHCPGTCTYCPYPHEFETKYGFKPSSENACRMSPEQFKPLVRQMAKLSGKAVVSLSSWGEPLFHPRFIDFVQAVVEQNGLSVMVETDGLLVNEELCRIVREIAGTKIIWIVSLDAVTEETYRKMRGGNATLAQAAASISVLQKYFPGNVYPQLVRTNINENELEKFYRYWKDDKSPSGGRLIIQKYDSFGGLLPDCKPADLSPLERNPCWHIRRDLTILADGCVPVCREYMFNKIIGNVFKEELASVWQYMTPYVIKDKNGQYDEKCRKCDEYYTFNF
ncbi:MAG: spiro-SPASM protein [Treponema sp.]|nr:spiro-SPASM protein [Treponema sp.]